jgi:hypothetical protein
LAFHANFVPSLVIKNRQNSLHDSIIIMKTVCY